jgi:type III secretion protein J
MRALNFILLVALSFLVSCNSLTTVAYNLHERDANEIVVLLTSQGVAAEKQPAPTGGAGGESGAKMWNILVPGSKVTEAISILNRAGLPRAKGTSLLDLFGEQGLVPSEMQNKIRYQEGLSEQLANTIRKMDGIVDADVQITFPPEDSENLSFTASVYVKHRGVLDNPNSLMIGKIKRLVSSALPGLTIDNVSVITDRALFSDMTLESADIAKEYDFVSVWGIILAKDSIFRFRVIFYAFIFTLFVIASLCVWLIWKSSLIIKQAGFKSLIDLKPFPASTDLVTKNAAAPKESSEKSPLEQVGAEEEEEDEE